MDDFLADIRHAVRMFWRTPAFTMAFLAALALGIGADTAIFSVVNAVLLKPLTYPEPDRIVQLLTSSPQGDYPGASATKFHIWQEQTSVLQDVAAYDYAGKGMNLTGAIPEQIHGEHVTEAYFRLFGARVIHGRTFTLKEDQPNGGNVVVLSNGFWKRKFGGDPNVVGRSLSLGGETYTIVGVIGPDFDSDPMPDLWLPFQFPPNSNDQANYFRAAGRLKPGVTLNQAKAQLKLAYAEYKRRYTDADTNNNSFSAEPLKDSIVGDVRSSLLVLIGAVTLVLLIACANVANLLMVRAAARKREFAIRAAMGARPRRIIRQLLTESILLSLAGGAIGLCLGFAAVRWLLSIRPGDIPRVGEDGAGVSIDWRVALFTVGVSILTGLIFGLFPALGTSRPDLATTMNEGGSRSGFGLRHSKARSVLIVSEIGLALVLLVGASLFIRTSIALRMVQPGFDVHNVITMELALTGPRYAVTAGVARLIHESRERIQAIPGVEDVGITNSLPLDGGFGLPFIVVGRPLTGQYTGDAEWKAVSPGYFGALRIPVLRGRDFAVGDVAGAPPVVILSDAFVKKNWKKGEDPIGQQIIIGKGVGPEFEEPARTIIGIVGDVHDGALDRPVNEVMIIPLAQMTDGLTALNGRVAPLTWIIRTHTDPHLLVPAISEQMRIASGGFPVANVRTMDEVVVRSTSRQDFNMLLLSIFGFSALLLAAIGIYGLMAYSVEQRVREIGIRMALGADRHQIRGMVVWHGMRLAIAGIVLGIGAAFALTRLIASSLYGVKSWDPAVFITVPLLLSLVALASTWIPAVRASKLDPMQALRID